MVTAGTSPILPQDKLCQACRWPGPRRGHRKTEGQDKEEEEVEAGRRPGCGERVVIGQFSINKLKIITKTHVSVFFLGQN